jgi:WD40 repeat protein
VVFIVYTGGWVHSVSFSADGNRLAWVGHDSSINVYDAANSQQSVELYQMFLTSYFLACFWFIFISEWTMYEEIVSSSIAQVKIICLV